MRVVITTQGRSDLANVAQFIARENQQRARSFVRELRAKALDLGNAPLAFPLVARYARQGVRRRVFGNYLIFCRVDAEAVIVLRVLHGARDYERLLEADASRGAKGDNDHD